MPFASWPYSSLFEDLARLQEEAGALLSVSPATRRGGVFPAVDIYGDGESFLVRAEIPGIDKDSLEITATGDQLTVRGERRIDPAGSSCCYHRAEREGGRFRRVVTLPERVDSSKVQATYRSGVLEILLPRAEESKSRKISIQ